MATLIGNRPTIQTFHRVIGASIEKGLTKSGPTGRTSDGFIYVLDGIAHYELEGTELKRYTLDAKPGDFIFLSKGTVYAMTVKSENYKVIIVNFDFMPIDTERLRCIISPYGYDKNAEKLFDRLLSIWRLQSTTVKEECLSVLYALYASFLQAITTSTHVSPSHRLMKDALHYIHSHLMEESLSIAEIAATVHMSESHFRRSFKQMYNVPPGQYIIAQRISLAKEKICYSTDTITAISEELGFSSVFRFSHAFKKEVGCSPNQYRAYYRQFPKT